MNRLRHVSRTYTYIYIYTPDISYTSVYGYVLIQSSETITHIVTVTSLIGCTQIEQHRDVHNIHTNKRRKYSHSCSTTQPEKPFVHPHRDVRPDTRQESAVVTHVRNMIRNMTHVGALLFGIIRGYDIL